MKFHSSLVISPYNWNIFSTFKALPAYSWESHPIEIIQTGEETRNRLQKTIDVKIQTKYTSQREMQLYERGTTLISIVDNELLRLSQIRAWQSQ